MKQGTFRVLMVWIDGDEAYADARLAEELAPEHVVALGAAGASRRRGFLLLARRNFEIEFMVRRVQMPNLARRLFELPESAAVDRLIGWWDDTDRYHPGLAGLTEIEARVLDLRIVDRRSTAEVGVALSIRDKTVQNHLSEARRKLRAWFYPPQLVVSCHPSGAAPALPDSPVTCDSEAIKNGKTSQLRCAAPCS